MPRRARAATIRTRSRLRMRSSLPLAAGVVCLVVPLLAQQPQGTPQPQAPDRSGVQVGVPQGRAGGAPPQGGPGRGRQAGPPQAPPRNATGRVLLGGATPKQRNGVWLPGGAPVTA